MRPANLKHLWKPALSEVERELAYPRSRKGTSTPTASLPSRQHSFTAPDPVLPHMCKFLRRVLYYYP
jgi:hypothetical protein